MNLVQVSQHKLFVPGLLLVLIFLGFGRSLNNGVSLDDKYVVNEVTEKGIEAIPELARSHYYSVDGQAGDYRPVATIVFALEHELFGSNIPLSHFINLLLYFFVCLAVYRFLKIVFPDQPNAFIVLALIIFTVHPLHVEVVASLKNRDELIVALCGFSAANVFLQMKDYSWRGWYNWLLVMVLLFTAVMSKKTGFTFFGIIVLTKFFITGSFRKTLPALLAILPLVAYKLINGKIIGISTTRNFAFHENPLYVWETNILDRMPMAGGVMMEYIGLFAIPHPLSFYYGYNQVTLHGWDSGIGVLSVLVLLGVLYLAFRKWQSKTPWAYGLVFFLLTMGLYSNLLKPAVGIMAERFAFVPILGLCIALGYGIYRLFKWSGNNQLVYALPLVIIGGFTYKSFDRTGDWYSQKSLLAADIEHLEKSAKANFLYGIEMLSEIESKEKPTPFEVDRALKHFRRAYTTDTTYKQAYHNAGHIHFKYYQNMDSASIAYSKAILIDTLFPEPIFGLGNVFLQQGHTDYAILAFEKAYQLDSTMMVAKQMECEVYMRLERYDDLMRASREALQDGHHQAGFYLFLGDGHEKKGNLDSTVFYLKRAYDITPTDELCSRLRQLGKRTDRLKVYEEFNKRCPE